MHHPNNELLLMDKLKAVIDEECAWRFVTGVVMTNIQADVLHLAVDVPQNPTIKQARLEFDSKERSHYQAQQQIPLFLLSPVSDKPELWHAVDGLMAERDHNPWRQLAFSEGDTLEGVVKDYVENDAAIITLTGNLTRELDWRGFKGLTGFLHKLRTPEGFITPNIRRILHVGDTVQAMLAGSDGRPAIDHKLLHLRLDVNQLLKQRERQADNKEPVFPVSALQQLDTGINSETQRPEKKLLLVDDEVGENIRYCIKINFSKSLPTRSDTLLLAYQIRLN